VNVLDPTPAHAAVKPHRRCVRHRRVLLTHVPSRST
jgi:hypothetical protein